MDRGAWQATVHWVTRSWTRLSDSHSLHNVRKAYLFSNKEKRSERVVVVDGGRGARDKCGVLCHPTFKLHLKSWVSETQLSVQFSQSCPTLCDPVNRSTPGLPVHHQLPEFIQTHVHRVGDAIQPSHPLSSPSPPALNPSQHHGLFQ